MNIPPRALRLEKVKDLFRPDQDTTGIVPRKILVIGRPGIGKTVLTEKVIRDWANGVDEYYNDKIAFVFKFRWFNLNELKDQSLKSFLQVGTRLVGKEHFDSIYEEVVKDPQKAILVFDGLDELDVNPMSFLDQSELIPNDCDTCVAAVNLFLKIFMGSFLDGATVLVTSRATTHDFCSRVHFDRQVEIIGFTSEKIEEYIIRFCENNNRSDLKPKIWSNINSSSELLHLCYIPENCFIVCVTLSGCLSDPKNETSALPTTLTDVYQTAIDHFLKHHHRNVSGSYMPKNVLEKLQQISFRGMENGQLIFDQQLFDEETKGSGLVNSLSNPIFPTKLQFCFIHFTIQKFLAARHVTETFPPEEIKKFISSHVRQSKWRLVLQFIAGLLGKNLNMFDWKYRDCISTFAESFEQTREEFPLTYSQVSIMKCLKEVEDPNIVKYACEKNVIKDAVKLSVDPSENVSSSDLEAVIFVCQHLSCLTRFSLNIRNLDCFQEILKFLKGRCIYELNLLGLPSKSYTYMEHVVMTLMNSVCTVNHKHVDLTVLTLSGFSITEVLTIIFPLLGHARASHLKILNLTNNKISSKGMSKLCEMLDDEHFPELTELDLSQNPIHDEGASLLFQILTKGPRKLTRLTLDRCSLTHQFMPSLDGDCKLACLSLRGNNLSNGGLRLLCDNFLSKEYCELTKLILGNCSVTHKCISILCKALRVQHSELRILDLWNNPIGDEGACKLFENTVTKEHCKLTALHITRCALTPRVIPTLCRTFKHEHCKLTKLRLTDNAIGDEGVCELFESALTNEHCKLTELSLAKCSLTDKCISSLCRTLRNERCVLKELNLLGNEFTDDGKIAVRKHGGVCKVFVA